MEAFTIRPTRSGDGPGVAALRRMPGVRENILGFPAERDETVEEKISASIKDKHQFVAVVRDERGGELIIGTAMLSLFPNPRLRHSATVGLMVHADYQGRGVGTALLKELLDLADLWLMLKRVELGVLSDNKKAIRLYEKFGFQKEGTRKMAVIRNGEYVDEDIMARIRTEKGE